MCFPLALNALTLFAPKVQLRPNYLVSLALGSPCPVQRAGQRSWGVRKLERERRVLL
jgi:hypothetical protein